ncbi:MAG: transglutaminase domain-containing protein, partial [Phycisphaerales bacterium]
RMKTLARLLLGSLFLLLVAEVARSAEAIDPRNPPEGLFSDEWLEVHLGGSKIGYGHNTCRREGDAVHTATEMHLRIGRAGQAIELGVKQKSKETVDGTPLAFSSEMDFSAQTLAMKGTIADGVVKVTTSQAGIEQTQEYDFPDGALMSWGLLREGLIRGYKPGVEYTLDVYEPQSMLNAAIKTITKIGDWEEFDHRGQKLRGMRAEATMVMPVGTMRMTSWVAADGTVLKGELPFPGVGDLVLYSVDEATALGDFMPPEIFMTTTITVPRIDTQKARAIKFRVTLKDQATEPLELPTTGMQKPKVINDRAAEVIVMRQRHVGPANIEYAAPSDPALREYLDSNLSMNLEDPELIKVAKEASGGAKDPFELADNLRRFARDYISNKSLDIGFATAGEVCRTREGDCSEHGVFLAALGRVNGLPSRVVVGLAYAPIFGGATDIMGYHMWTQFYINGEWYDFDAALGDEREPSPARIAFAVSSLKHAGLVELSLALIGKMGLIDLEVVEVR